MKSIGILLVASLVWLAIPAGAQQLAADLPVGTPATVPPLTGSDNVDATCLAWTDGCRMCQRTGADVSCSNIGIACQPKAVQCTTRKEEPAK